jgi:RNA polymerase sigma-70 factor (ECF subfamily)
MSQETPLPPQFPPTRWTVVLAATAGGNSAEPALEEFCRLYWFPLYAFARQRGLGAEDAEDQTQDFLARLVSGELLSSVCRERGRLRTFLLAAFERDLMDAHRRENRQKRGGKFQFVSLQSLGAEDRFAGAPQLATPSATFDRAWALSCLQNAASALKAEHDSPQKAALYQALHPFLDPTMDSDHSTAAAATGLEAGALRQAIFRLRRRYRALLRQVVAQTLEMPTEAMIDEELSALRAALAE